MKLLTPNTLALISGVRFQCRVYRGTRPVGLGLGLSLFQYKNTLFIYGICNDSISVLDNMA
jgi:hypothetical protein